jgi:hypothetical protein
MGCSPHAEGFDKCQLAGKPLKFAKMDNAARHLISTRLQPGAENPSASEPFQRLVPRGETVETVFASLAIRLMKRRQEPV